MDTRTDRIVEVSKDEHAALKQIESFEVMKDFHREIIELEGGEIPRHLRPVNIPLTPKQRDTMKIGRNDKCPCGSGIKYKKCCRGK